ncbi:hypothetical protein BH20ACT6_BH20ACT6_10980 [soil metagenome]
MRLVNGLEAQPVTDVAPAPAVVAPDAAVVTPPPAEAAPAPTAVAPAAADTDARSSRAPFRARPPSSAAGSTGATAVMHPPVRRAPWVGAEPPAGRVLTGAIAALVVAAFVEILLVGSVGLLLGLSLVAASIGVALTVRPRDLFTAGVSPPLLLVGVLLVVAVLHGEGIQVGRLVAEAGVAQRVIAGFVHLAGTLVVAHALALVVVALRGRVHRRRRPRPAA